MRRAIEGRSLQGKHRVERQRRSGREEGGGREEGRGEATRGGEDEGESEEAHSICVGGERRSIFASPYVSKAKCVSSLRCLLEALPSVYSA